MKRIKYLLLLCIFPSLAMAQQEEKKAFALLDSISQHNNFQATFTYHSQAPQEQPGEALQGTITVQGNQYRLVTAEQEIINNGKTVWTYLMAAKEVQINDYNPDQETATPWAILTNYRQDYSVFSFRTQQVGDQCYEVIDLLVKDKACSLLKITLTIEQATKHIKRLEALDSNKTLHIFCINHFVTDVALYDTFFSFSPEQYAGIEIIDMR